MPEPRPLLSICVPTYNRSRFLGELLASASPQMEQSLRKERFAELLVSDNASTDDTAMIVEGFGPAVQYYRNETNLGADQNFLRCLSLARGKYVWVLGDDDLVMPGAVASLLSLLGQGEESADFDLVYLSSFGFVGTLETPPAPVTLADRFGRFAEVVTDGAYLLEKINALIGLISVVIINRDRLESMTHPPIASLSGTNLIQTGWIFPLLHRRCRVLYVWQRLVGYRHFNSGGWGICEVFGVRLEEIARRYFAEEPELARSLTNGVLRYWLPDSIMLARNGRETAMRVENITAMLAPIFRGSWRYWMFVYPTATLPLPLARAVHRVLRLGNRFSRIAQAVWRRVFRQGKLLRPEPFATARQQKWPAPKRSASRRL